MHDGSLNQPPRRRKAPSWRQAAILALAIPALWLAILAVFFLVWAHSAHAQSSTPNYECAADLNGDGAIDQPGEVQPCYQSTWTSTSGNCQQVTQACTTSTSCTTSYVQCEYINNNAAVNTAQPNIVTGGHYWQCPGHASNACTTRSGYAGEWCQVQTCQPPVNTCTGSPSTACSPDSSGQEVCTYTPSSCTSSSSGYLCPLQAQNCSADATGNYSCPLGSQFQCMPNSAGTYQCSPNQCVNTNGSGVVSTPSPDQPTPTSNAPVTSSGCTANIRIFPGRAASCKGQGLQTAWQDCCKARTQVTDTMGNSSSNNQQPMLASAMSTAIPFYPQCSTSDAQTGMERQSGYCIYIGDYCALSWPLVGCVQSAHSYCCFNSMLARIIQQQGRPQLPEMGGFGSPGSPNCRGFSPAEFQSLDFSKIDLSEYYTELQYSSQSTIQSEVNTSNVPAH